MSKIEIKSKCREKVFSIALIITLIMLVLILFKDLIPILKNVSSHIKNEGELTSYIQSYGSRGVLIIIALQALQVITTIFPSAAVQILAGMSYGIFYGMIFCIIGYILGNSIVFIIVRQINKAFMPYIPKFTKKNTKKNKWDFSFLKESKHAARMAFILFLIPGLPNGILPYLFARTKISLPRYLLSIVLAGIPSILICSSIGQQLSVGDTSSALIILSLLVLIATTVFLFRKQFMQYLREKSK